MYSALSDNPTYHELACVIRHKFRVADYPVIGSVSATAFIVTYFFPLELPACTIADDAIA